MKSKGSIRSLIAGLGILLIGVFATSLFLNMKVTYAASYCQVTYTVTNQWPGGFGTNVTIQNTSSSAWTSWNLAFAFPTSGQAVTQPGWNGAFIQSGQNVTVTNLSWNGNVAVNGSVSPGFNGTWAGSNPIPTGFAVNGNPCNGAVQTTPTSVSVTQMPTSILSTPTPPRLTPTPTPNMPIVITHGNPNLPEVALTFDDGPSTYTQQVLAVLQRYNVKATFFPIGQNVSQFPTALQQDLAGGNAVGNHSFTHPHLATLPFASIFKELNDTQNAILNATGTRPTLFRPPFGEYNADVLTAAGQLGLTVVTWSAVANDWDNPQPSAAIIASRILSAAGNGAIFLLHEGGGNRANTVAALPAIIEGLLARGLRLVTIPQMLADINQ